MKTIKQKLVTRLAALIAAATPALAHADFYDGVRGPSTAQVHYTLSSQDTTTHTIAGKYFGGGFVGIGYIAEHFKRIKAIPVVGYATSGDGKKGTLNAILQATAFLDENGTFLADSRYVVSVPMHGQENHTPAHTFGLTLSAGNERLRVGPDLNYTLKDKKVASGALIRYDLDAQHHSSWVEFGMGLEGNAQLQFRGNF